METIQLPFVSDLSDALSRTGPRFIQVVLGPRQVGKTTGISQLLAGRADDHLYRSADGLLSRSADWLHEQWVLARSNGRSLLVIDEVQKVENWPSVVKQLWDEQQMNPMSGQMIDVVLLGSSSLDIQRGLSESLAGRYRLHRVHHWNLAESAAAYGLSLEDYLLYGGYPASYSLLDRTADWLAYIRYSIVEAVIGKDILTNARVKSPALFRQCFDLVCAYPAQEISYTKLLGQLQDRGNTDLVKYYLELFEGAYLVKQLFKYSGGIQRQRSSSPKLLPMCPALYTATLDGDLNAEERGRSFELTVGAALSRLPGRLFYWREKDAEVDYVYEFGKRLFAIEVKSGRKKSAKGPLQFKKRYPRATALIVTPENLGNLAGLLHPE